MIIPCIIVPLLLVFASFNYAKPISAAGSNDVTLLSSPSTRTSSTTNVGIHNKTLRILPLGDSITQGWRSTGGNGYRLTIVEDLEGAGNTVWMVGSQESGSAPLLPPQDHHEGHDGAFIGQTATYMTASLPERPNVVLLHAGTNDMNVPLEPETAPDRLASLIDQVVAACPDAAVLVAQIIPSSDNVTQARIATFNDAIPGIVAERASTGKHVMVVDMPAVFTTNFLLDSLHPTDDGYALMGDIWCNALEVADQKGWINCPVNNGSGPVNCTDSSTSKPQISLTSFGGRSSPDMLSSALWTILFIALWFVVFFSQNSA